MRLRTYFILLVPMFVAVASAQVPVQRLAVDQVVDRELAGGQTHLYSIEIRANSFVEILAHQNGVDIAIALVSPAGQVLVQRDSPNGTQGPETVDWVIGDAGVYSIRIESIDRRAATGRYDVRIAALRDATTAEIKKIPIQPVYEEALQLGNAGTAESMTAAMPKFEEALALFSAAAARDEEINCLNWLGNLHNYRGERTRALGYHERALKLAREISDKRTEAATLNNIGAIHSSLGRQPEAIEYYTQVLARFREVGDIAGEAIALNNIGNSYDRLSERRKALEYYAQALPLHRRVKYRAGEAVTLINIGAAHFGLGEGEKTIEFYNQALVILRETGDIRAHAVTLSNLGFVYGALGDQLRALDHFRRTIPLQQEIGDNGSEGVTLNNIGLTYAALGENQKALDAFLSARGLLEKVGDKANEATVLQNIGAVYESQGTYHKAIEFYMRALPLRRAVGDKNGEATTLNNLGTVYTSLGEHAKAIGQFNLSIPILREIGDRRSEAITLNNIGFAYYQARDLKRAMGLYEQALSVHRAVANKSGEATVLNNLALIFDDNKHYERAVEYNRMALELSEEIGDRSIEATALSNLGQVFAHQGDHKRALEFYLRAMPLRIFVGDLNGEAVTLNNLMFAAKALGAERLAVFFGKTAVNRWQTVRGASTGLDTSTQQSLLRKIEYSFRSLSEMLIEQNRLAEAQQVLNLFKDQQFFDFEARSTVSLASLTQREAEIGARYSAAEESVVRLLRRHSDLKQAIGKRQPNSDETHRLKKFEHDTQRATDDYLSIFNSVETDSAKPSNEKDAIGPIRDLTEMQAALRVLSESTGQRTVTIYQLVGNDRLSLILITPNSVKSFSSHVAGKVVNDRAKKFWALLQSPEFDTTKLGRELYDAVFKPLEGHLPRDTRTILWALDGNLRYVPPAALFDGERFLVERYQNVVITRADLSRLTRNVSASWAGTGFGASRPHTVSLLGDSIRFAALPGVISELEQIFKIGGPPGILPGDVLNDERFGQKAMLERMKLRRPVVHVASHFSFRPGDESRSFLLLGDGTAFTLADMKTHRDLFAGVELLTLSACNTAAQQADANGREVDAFFELAQRLGAQSVLATLWPVADNSTPWLMREFYDLKVNKKLNKAEALRHAQLALLRGSAKAKRSLTRTDVSRLKVVVGDSAESSAETRAEAFVVGKKDAVLYRLDRSRPFAHPFYWSPFILIGNWR